MKTKPASFETLFDEMKEVHVETVNSKARFAYEETITQVDAQEIENA